MTLMLRQLQELLKISSTFPQLLCCMQRSLLDTTDLRHYNTNPVKKKERS